MADPSQYCYEALDANKSHTTRLARILPSQPDGEIALSLENVSLEEVEGTYDAVSYTWGPPEPCHTVFIDGKHLSLRENIYRFLYHCTKHDFQLTYLWIDSICIDQKNVPEKNAQVAMMGQIFEKAKRVLVWLGSDSEPGHLDQWHDRARSIQRPHDTCWLEELPSLLQEMQDHEVQKLEYDLKLTFCNPYWGRLWIVQEIALAQHAHLILGALLVAVPELLPLTYDWEDHLDMHEATIEKQERALHAIRERLNMIRGVIWKSDLPVVRSSWPLWELVPQYKSSKCEDKRDSIYGLLGMVDLVMPFPVDYNCTKEELFARTLLYFQLEAGLALASFDNISALMDVLHVTAAEIAKFETSMPDYRTKIFRENHMILVLHWNGKVKCCDTDSAIPVGHETPRSPNAEPEKSHEGQYFRRLPLERRAQPKSLLECDDFDIIQRTSLYRDVLLVQRNNTTHTLSVLGLGIDDGEYQGLERQSGRFARLPPQLTARLESHLKASDSGLQDVSEKHRAIELACSVADIACLVEVYQNLNPPIDETETHVADTQSWDTDA